MNTKKVDASLLSRVSASQTSDRLECLVQATHFGSLKQALQSSGVEIENEYLFINSFFVKATKAQITYLSRLASVKYICANASAMALMNVARKVLKAPQKELTGKGVGVAFIDTGAKMHSDFCLGENRIKTFIDFVGNRSYAYDDNGHGTFVAGVCSGSGAASCGKYAGFAPQSEMHILKALDKNGEASASKILSAMEWIYDNHTSRNIRVVCMSFGSDPLGYNDPIMNGAEALWKSGVIVVAAAGNNGPEYQSIKSPGVSRKLITVGGIDDNRYDDDHFSPALFEIASFSSRGPAMRAYKPDVVAPAVDICSCGIKNDYEKLSGTSVATPMIAGVMCLLCEKYPQITPDEAKKKLLLSSVPISFNRNFEGSGYPDLSKLL